MNKIFNEFINLNRDQSISSKIAEIFCLDENSKLIEVLQEKYKNNRTIDTLKFVSDIAPICKLKKENTIEGSQIFFFFK